MVNAIQAAQERLKAVLDSTYPGRLTVTEYRKVRDEITKVTSTQPVAVLTDVPCKLSYKTVDKASPTDTVSSKVQVTELILAPDVEIRPGSKLTVTQAGVTADYKSSGQPAVYPSHQEIIVELSERWA